MVWQTFALPRVFFQALPPTKACLSNILSQSRETCPSLAASAAKAFEANGVGILEKVFDIGWSLADVLQLHPSSMQSG